MMKRFSILPLCLFTFISCAAPKFQNIEPIPDKGILDILKWRFTEERKDWPEWIDSPQYKIEEKRNHSETIKYTVINHATVLIQWHGINIITDPIYAQRSSPVSWAGPKRVRAPGVSFDDLPPIDIVVISHNHYDHLDLETLQKLNLRDHPLFLVGMKNGELLKSEGIENYKELNWWEKVEYNNLTFTFVPAQHWSARGIFDRKETLWGGHFISDKKKHIYFAGDTGYGKFFKEIKEKMGSPVLSFLPIGAYAPRWFMKNHHMDPSDAIMAHKDLGSRSSVGIHFETFRLTDEAFNEPRSTFNVLWQHEKKEGIASDFIAPEFGKTYTLNPVGKAGK